MISWIAAHRKGITAVAGFALSLASLAWPNANWLPPVIAAASAVGVYVIPNTKKAA